MAASSINTLTTHCLLLIPDVVDQEIIAAGARKIGEMCEFFHEKWCRAAGG